MIITPQQIKDNYNLIVVGSGPAGITVAKEFSELNPEKSVLIIESGITKNSNTIQTLSNAIATGSLNKDHYQLHNQRILGGTSTIWAGFCATLEERAFLNNEWPISFTELNKNYPKAAQILNLPKEVHTRSEISLKDEANIVYRPYYLSPPTRFNSKKTSNWLKSSSNCEILFEHTLKNISFENNHAKQISIIKSNDNATQEILISAQDIVLACGGIQNAKILQQTLPNNSMPIGEYFQEHPHIYASAQLTLDADAFNKAKDKKNKRIVHAISVDSKTTHKNKSVSATFEVKDKSAQYSKKNLLGRSANTLTSQTNIRMEMKPLQSNKVSLAKKETDFLGNPQPEINLVFDKTEIQDAFKLLSDELLESGLGRMTLLPDSIKVYGGGHMIGSTRMGEDKTTSVTDSNCKVHDTTNLYIAGSSLYPAGAAANPTLTIVNLALRLAKHLSKGNEK